jgi:hypothetical protein
MTGSRQNFARSNVRLRPDYGRIAKAVSRPGIDPRSWIALARVDNDPDATVWDEQIGWIVDVHFLDGEGPTTCRVVSGSQGSGVGASRPVRPDSLVAVLIPNGDPNYDAIIVGDLHDVDEMRAPTTINGDAITEALALTTHIDAFPSEDLDQEFANVRITAATAMVLGAAQANQPFVRGDDYADALDAFLDDLLSFMNSLIAAVPAAPNGALTVADAIAAATPMINSIATFKAARAEYLSTLIKGD